MKTAMSTPKERLDVIQGVYHDAVTNEPNDLAQATTAAQVSEVLQNVANARHTYYAAAVAALSATSPEAEVAYLSAKDALAAVEEARAKSAQLATLFQKVSGATAAATKLLNAAKSTA